MMNNTENNESAVEEMEVKSPCIRQCRLDDNDICLGCYRSLEEILNWAASPAAKKREVLMLCQQRRES